MFRSIQTSALGEGDDRESAGGGPLDDFVRSKLSVDTRNDVHGGVGIYIASPDPCAQALAIMALGVKEKVTSLSDNLSFHRKRRTVRHGFRVAEDLDASFWCAKNSGLLHPLNVVNLLISDLVLWLILAAT